MLYWDSNYYRHFLSVSVFSKKNYSRLGVVDVQNMIKMSKAVQK